MRTYDCVIVGAGVVGLSLAYDLSAHGWSVLVADRREPGREASWAGAGILPPANRATARHAYDHLRGLSFTLHARWAEQLREQTGIDTGFRRCGAVYVGRSVGEAASLRGWSGLLKEEAVRIEALDEATLAEVEPGLAGTLALGRARVAYYLPDEVQLRNPRHLQALQVACAARGVEIRANAEVLDWKTDGDRIVAAETAAGPLFGERFCVTSGAWTQRLLARLNVPTGILPIRGQMLQFQSASPPCRRIINDGPRYIVPRDDGLTLVGSTEEEVGFDCRTTDEAIAELSRLARDLLPALADAQLVRSWAGLRPASFDSMPYIGRLPGLQNGYAAAGHFRSGLYLSPGTATVLGQLMRGEPTDVDLGPFNLARG